MTDQDRVCMGTMTADECAAVFRQRSEASMQQLERRFGEIPPPSYEDTLAPIGVILFFVGVFYLFWRT